MGELKIDGLIEPGHVSTIIGSKPYEFILIKTDDSGLKKIIIGLILCSDNEGRIEVLDSSGTIKSIIERNPELKNKVKKN